MGNYVSSHRGASNQQGEEEERHLFPRVAHNHMSPPPAAPPRLHPSSPSPSSPSHITSTSYISVSAPPPREPVAVSDLESSDLSSVNPPNSTVFHGFFAPADQLTSSPSITSSVIAHGSSAEQSSVASTHRPQRADIMPEYTSRLNDNHHFHPPPPLSSSPAPAHQHQQHYHHPHQRHHRSRTENNARRHAWDRERLPDATSFSYRRPFNTIFSGNRRTDTGNDLSPIRRRRQSRLSNLRHSIAAPISNLLGHNASPERPAPVFLSNLLPRRRSATNSQVDSLFRPFIGTDTSPPEMARNIPSPVLETHGERLSIETQSSPDQSDTSSLTLTAVSDRQLGGLDNNPTLARILAIAASAISSQPEDNDSRITVANNQPPVGEVSINDSLRTIINSLQRRHANERNESGGGGERRGSSRNINFVRAFLVDNNNPNGPLNPARHIGGGRGNTSPPTANGQGYSGRFDDSSPPLPPPRFHDFFDSDDGGEEDSHMTGTTSPRRRSSIGSNRSQSPSRSITLVIVGVRAMRSTTNTPQRQSSGSEAGEVMRESSNPLSRLRASSGLSRNGNATGNGSSAATTTRESSGGRGFRLGRTRFSLRRRRLNTEITTRGNEAQAHGPRIPDSSISREAFSPIGVYDSPPGPAPPPTTPADPSLLSAPPSHSVTPRRLSTASNTLREVQGNGPVGNGNGGGGAGGGGGGGGGDGGDNSTQTTLGTPTVHIRQRRRSDSEAERHRGLGSGSSRRNGVVEPDDSGNPSAGRSWLIYVIGTNLSEVNPALLMPSLFTNSPTYEDMLMLSSLMGQVKTPVASESDVAGAQGLHTVVEVEGQLVAEMIHQDTEGNDEVKHSNGPQSRSGTSPPVRIPVQGERCLVCLSEYETGEEVRRLLNCKHIFHRQCIDQWLTTGRNSCPMCREQGVSENPTNSDSTLRFPSHSSGVETVV